MLSVFNSFSQTNLIKNPSFENRQEQPNESGIFLKPKTLSFIYPPDFVPQDHNDEITRCLGDYNNNNQPPFRGYPNPERRHLAKSNGGCDGWYNPLNEIINQTEGSGSTPDYFNREVNQYDDLEKMVWVPNNFFNNYGQNDGDKQQPFDDNNNGSPDENAYVGLYNTRKFDDTLSDYNYSEYITQRFEYPLLTNKVYILRFRTSWTINGSQTIGNPRQTGHYLKGIGAYFTSTDPFVNRRNSGEPLNLEDRVYGLVYDNNYFSEEPTYYNQTGGFLGTNWQTVYNQFTPEVDKNFITIGNFQLNWNRDSRVRYIIESQQNYIPSDKKLRVYYFIDAVEVFEKPTNSNCNCSSSYNVTVEPILDEPGNDECCYFVKLNTYFYTDICHSNKAKIYVANVDGSNKTLKHEYTTKHNEFLDFANDLVIYDNLCFNQNEKGLSKKIIIELYYNSVLLCEVSKIFEVQCLCGCENNTPLDFNISLKPFYINPNYDGCCWNLELKNESNDCDFSVKDIFVNFEPEYDGDLEFTPISGDFNMIRLGPGSYKFTIISNNKVIEKGSTVILGKICTEWGTEPIQISMTYSNEEGICDREWEQELNCPDCCQFYDVDIVENADYSDDGYCCYAYSIHIDPFSNCRNELKIIKILDNNNIELWSSDDYSSTSPLPIIDGFLCISKTNFIGQLKIQFYNKLGQKVCEKTKTVNYCSDPPPCYPDYSPDSPGGVSFTEPIRKPTIYFKCSDGSWCNLDYTYRWRIVKSGGSVLHRDIKITSYKLGYCSCPNEIESHIDAMIKDAWNDQRTVTGFALYPPNINNWNVGETRCFNNFRVVTSDCWEERHLDQIHRRRCNDVQCCYAVYRVCYKKIQPTDPNALPVIKFLSYDKIDESSIIPQPCESGCEPQQCAKWRPAHGEYEIGANPRVAFDNSEALTNQECYVYIKTGKNSDEHFINLECGKKGNVIIYLFDLLGNVVSKKEAVKSDFILSIPVDENIKSGIYLIKISIDNDFIYYNKINIIK